MTTFQSELSALHWSTSVHKTVFLWVYAVCFVSFYPLCAVFLSTSTLSTTWSSLLSHFKQTTVGLTWKRTTTPLFQARPRFTCLGHTRVQMRSHPSPNVPNYARKHTRVRLERPKQAWCEHWLRRPSHLPRLVQTKIAYVKGATDHGQNQVTTVLSGFKRWSWPGSQWFLAWLVCGMKIFGIVWTFGPAAGDWNSIKLQKNKKRKRSKN